MQTVDRTILELRRAKGWTQAQLAAMFNSSPPLEVQTTRVDIAKYETGATLPPGDKLLKFLEVLK